MRNGVIDDKEIVIMIGYFRTFRSDYKIEKNWMTSNFTTGEVRSYRRQEVPGGPRVV